MRRRTTLVGALGAAAVAGTVVTGAVVSGAVPGGQPSTSPDPDEPDEPAGDGDREGETDDLELAAVEQRDLARVVGLEGVIGYGERTPLRLAASGTLTWLPEVGAVVEPGHRLAEVDGEPVLLLPGDRPAWRSLEPGVSKGEDVRQLEAALVALGFTTADDLEVDDRWTSDTTRAVKAMQAINEMPVDGRLALGEIVFAPGGVRIAALGAVIGDEASAAGVETTVLEPHITVSVDVENVELLAVGDDVEVELPSGESLPATVESAGAAEVADDGSVTVPVRLRASGLEGLEGVPVDLDVPVVEAEGAIAVPAEALLALAEGGYAVEVPDATAPTGTRLVAVDVGVFADGWVEVSGDVAAGDEVVIP